MERLKKKDAQGKFYKSSTKNKSFLITSNYLLLEKERKLTMSVIIGYQKKILID